MPVQTKFQVWRLFSIPSQHGLELQLKFPYRERKIPAPQNSPGFCVEVTASVCGENVLVAGAGNLRCGGRYILGQPKRKGKMRSGPELPLNILAGANNLVAQELLIGRAAIGVIARMAADFIAAVLQKCELLPGIWRKAVFVAQLVMGKFAAT